MLDAFEWRDVEDKFAVGILAELLDVDAAVLATAVHVSGQTANLPFYKRWVLLKIIGRPNEYIDMPETVFALWADGKRPQLLDGSNEALYAANEDEGLELKPEQVLDYIHYFLFVVRADEGAFIPFEKAPKKVPAGSESIAAMAAPLVAAGTGEGGEYLYKAKIIYGTALFDATLSVDPGGLMSMLDDEPLAADVPAQLIPSAPELRDGSWLLANLPPEATEAKPAEPEPEEIDAAKIVKVGRERAGRGKRRLAAGKATPAAAKPVIELMVELLLEHALTNLSRNRLIDHFNARTPAKDSLDRFAALMVDASPVVVIETTIPYVERVIARIVDNRTTVRIQMCEGQYSSEDSPLVFGLPGSGPAIVLIPYSINSKIAEVERLVFDMASRDIAALISCERVGLLSESLRQAQDIVLTLPALTPDLFATLFRRVFGTAPPAGWRRRAHEWVKFVRYTDFEHPFRMKLTPGDALDYIRGNVNDRLAAVDTRNSLRLNELHGLGDARQWAEDLITDIHAAMSGALPWSQVDSGALLAGAPGTGKTTLANAIARDCGIRFVRASATAWMAEGVSLGPHLQAIRRTFREAREFAPSILFIDEIDGLGSREQFKGDNNSIYQTEVINGVLEQMQGIDPAAPIFVIGATNHAERVDPALRRSGRLDRVIEIPRPNTDALHQIYRHYLRDLAPEVHVERGLDTRVLAGLSLGLTGADVARIVRGASRRARKENRSLREADLIDEITGRSRRTTDTLRLPPAELERVAIHEAGHALAAFLGPARGEEIGFTSVLPRDDGTLGFVAPLPDPRSLLTRRDFEDRLELFMGGRAAEELRYGADQVSNGAGSDLAQATKLVTALVARSGVSGNGSLFISDSLTEDDRTTAEGLLTAAYDRILRKLRNEEGKLKALAAELIARQELTGNEVRAILRQRPRKRAATANGL